jgi:hypothetical protein
VQTRGEEQEQRRAETGEPAIGGELRRAGEHRGRACERRRPEGRPRAARPA